MFPLAVFFPRYFGIAQLMETQLVTQQSRRSSNNCRPDTSHDSDPTLGAVPQHLTTCSMTCRKEGEGKKKRKTGKAADTNEIIKGSFPGKSSSTKRSCSKPFLYKTLSVQKKSTKPSSGSRCTAVDSCLCLLPSLYHYTRINVCCVR